MSNRPEVFRENHVLATKAQAFDGTATQINDKTIQQIDRHGVTNSQSGGRKVHTTGDEHGVTIWTLDLQHTICWGKTLHLALHLGDFEGLEQFRLERCITVDDPRHQRLSICGAWNPVSNGDAIQPDRHRLDQTKVHHIANLQPGEEIVTGIRHNIQVVNATQRAHQADAAVLAGHLDHPCSS